MNLLITFPAIFAAVWLSAEAHYRVSGKKTGKMSLHTKRILPQGTKNDFRLALEKLCWYMHFAFLPLFYENYPAHLVKKL